MRKVYFIIDYLKLYLIWHLILRLALGDISKAPTPFSTRTNSVFSTLDHSVKLSVYRSVCIFHYFLTWLETLPWPLEGIILVFQMHKIIFLRVPPLRAVLCYFFAHICILIPFFLFFFFLRTILLLHIIFYRRSWYYSEDFPTKKNFFHHLLICREPYWGILMLILRVCSSILEYCSPILSHKILYRYFLWQSLC